MGIKIVTSDRIPTPANPFSLAVKSNGFLFVSGQLGKDLEGNLQKGVADQTRQALTNLRMIVEDGGSSLERVVKVNVYLTDIKRIGDMNKVYEEFFTAHLPARATVEVSGLAPGAEIEIDAICAL